MSFVYTSGWGQRSRSAEVYGMINLQHNEKHSSIPSTVSLPEQSPFSHIRTLGHTHTHTHTSHDSSPHSFSGDYLVSISNQYWKSLAGECLYKTLQSLSVSYPKRQQYPGNTQTMKKLLCNWVWHWGEKCYSVSEAVLFIFWTWTKVSWMREVRSSSVGPISHWQCWSLPQTLSENFQKNPLYQKLSPSLKFLLLELLFQFTCASLDRALEEPSQGTT